MYSLNLQSLFLLSMNVKKLLILLSGICAPVLIFLTTPSAPFASDLPRFSKKKAISVGILFAREPKMP